MRNGWLKLAKTEGDSQSCLVYVNQYYSRGQGEIGRV